MAVGVAVAPAWTDEVVQAIPPDKLLAFIYVCDTLIKRLDAAKKAALIECQVAMEHAELQSIELQAEGHRFRYQQDSRNEFEDIPRFSPSHPHEGDHDVRWPAHRPVRQGAD